MNYKEVERELVNNVKGLNKQIINRDNFITPNVVGFVHINKDVQIEIAYGKFWDVWGVGTTVFVKGNLLPVAKRDTYDKLFIINEIEELNKHIDFIRENISHLCYEKENSK